MWGDGVRTEPGVADILMGTPVTFVWVPSGNVTVPQKPRACSWGSRSQISIPFDTNPAATPAFWRSAIASPHFESWFMTRPAVRVPAGFVSAKTTCGSEGGGPIRAGPSPEPRVPTHFDCEHLSQATDRYHQEGNGSDKRREGQLVSLANCIPAALGLFD